MRFTEITGYLRLHHKVSIRKYPNLRIILGADTIQWEIKCLHKKKK